MNSNPREIFDETDLVIFDLDGTLIDSSLDIANAVNVAFAGIGLAPWPVEDVKGMIGGGTKKLVKMALAGKEHLFDDAFEHFSQHYREHLLDHTRLYDGAKELFQQLSGKTLAILSNKRQSFCDPIVDGLSIREVFALVVGGDTPPRMKPKPDAVLYVCEKLGIAAQRAVMIGDSFVDVLAGKAAGAKTIGLTNGFTPSAEVKDSNPDLLLEKLSDLLT